MESAKNKICPIAGRVCEEEKCAWWCSFAQDCAVPLLAGMYADGEDCRTEFGGEKRHDKRGA